MSDTRIAGNLERLQLLHGGARLTTIDQRARLSQRRREIPLTLPSPRKRGEGKRQDCCSDC
jgi:hypothetical protein